MLNLHLLRIFTAVADAASFSRAAEVLYISQPAVSKAVQELERQLDQPLLDRSGRTITLTAAGSLLHHHAQQIFAIERAAETALAELEELGRGQLAIGASSTIGTYLLPALMGAFHRRYPGVQLFLDIGNTQQIAERLRMKPLDVAFVEGPVAGADLLVTPWREDRLVVIAAPNHPLAGQQPVALDRLLTVPFVLRELGSGTREVAEAALHARGVQAQVAMELGSTEAVKQAVAAGLGVSIVSEVTIALERELGRLTVLEVPGLLVRRTLTQLSVVGRPPSRALSAFLALSRSQE